MKDILHFANTYSGVLSVAISLITAIITLIYVIFTYRQMRAAQDALKMSVKQLKVDRQPCIVYKEITTRGSDCFYKARRQLHIDMKLQNIGDSPAMSIYVFSHLKLQHSEKASGIVNMEYLPDFVPFLKVDSKADVSTRYETDEINMLLEDLTVSSAKNIHRIKTDPSKHPYKNADLVVEVYYKNMLGQWFKNERCIEILDILEREEGGERKTVRPPNSLKDDVWFELRLVPPAFSQSDIIMVEEDEIKDKLQCYERDRPFASNKSSD